MKRKTEQEYFEVLDELTGGTRQAYEITNPDEIPTVLVAAYDDIPEPGELTGFTWGLSSVQNQEWTDTRPELMISVRSKDHAWVLAMGDIVRGQRGAQTFTYGSVIRFGEQISKESEMTAFLVFATNLLDASQQRIELPDRVINISQLYPIYEKEAAVIKKLGVEKFFWELGIEFSDVGRPAARAS